MKSIEELNSDIIKITKKIEGHFSALSKIFGEVPEIKSNNNNPVGNRNERLKSSITLN